MVERWGRSGTPRLIADSILKLDQLKKEAQGPVANLAFDNRTPLHSNLNYMTTEL